MLNAALAGFGLAYVPEDVALPHLAKGRLQRVLEDWCPPYSGYHLYYPSRRQSTPAFALLVEALRYRAPRSAWDGRPKTMQRDGGRLLNPGRDLGRDGLHHADNAVFRTLAYRIRKFAIIA
jgi:hypothetical protein